MHTPYSIKSFLVEHLKPFRLWIFLMLGVMTLWALDLSIRPYILKIIVDKLFTLDPKDIEQGVLLPAVLYGGLTFLLVLAFRVFDYSWLKLNAPLKRAIGDSLSTHLMYHSQSFYKDHFAGSLSNKVKDVMSAVPDMIFHLINKVLSQLLAVIVAIVVLFHLKPVFALMMGGWVVLFLMGSLYFSKKAKVLSAKSAEARSVVTGKLVDIFSNSLSIWLFHTMRFEKAEFKKELDEYVKKDQRRDFYLMRLYAFQGFSYSLYQVVCLIGLIHLFKKGHVTAGDFVLLFSINSSIISSMWGLSRDITKTAEHYGIITQGLALAFKPYEIIDCPNAKILNASHGEISFEEVGFSYHQQEMLFADKSVLIRAGQKVGLVGYSGGGKTTFINLILRLYDVSHGKILIDGQDIKTITQESLHQAITMIPQDPALFHRSIRDNILYGSQGVDDEALKKAARSAHALDFINDLPNGFDTLVGERGVKLSGGQRQRIVIARAFLKKAPILILDEATSQLDSLTENYIQESLYKLMQQKTTLVVAHRLSTLLKMDRILVFDQGKIIQDGSHEELLIQKEGLYKKLWERQVGGFLSLEN